MSMYDGVNKVWILRAGRGLNVEGYIDDIAAMVALIHNALGNGPPEARTKIEAAVAEALKHLDEDAAPLSERGCCGEFETGSGQHGPECENGECPDSNRGALPVKGAGR